MLHLVGYRKLTMSSRYVTSVNCPKIQKSLKAASPVFDLIVHWSDGPQQTIVRHYTEIFDFVQALKQAYGGTEIPELKPGKWFESRWKVKEEKRKVIEEFFQKILALPQNIVRGEKVKEFFEYPYLGQSLSDQNRCSTRESSETHIPSAGAVNLEEGEYESFDNENEPYSCTTEKEPYNILNIKPKSVSVFDCKLSDDANSTYWAVLGYAKRKSGEVDLKEGAAVSVLQRELSGWWFVHVEDTNEQGWAPASCLLPADRSNVENCKVSGPVGDYVAMKDFEGEESDEVPCKKGDRVEVIEVSLDGWWMVRCKGKVGRIPATNLEPASNQTNFRSSLYHQVGIYKKCSPPPRRNSKVSVDELYAKVDRCHQGSLSQKELPVSDTFNDMIAEYAEVDHKRNFTSSNYNRKEFEDHSDSHCYVNTNEATRNHPYVNVKVKPQRPVVVVKYYKTKERYAPNVKHQGQPCLAVEAGDIVECHTENADKIYGKLYQLDNGSYPNGKEGWIPKTFLEPYEPGSRDRESKEGSTKPAVSSPKPVLPKTSQKPVSGRTSDPAVKQQQSPLSQSNTPIAHSRSEANFGSTASSIKAKPTSAGTEVLYSEAHLLPVSQKSSVPQAFTVRKLSRTECENLLLNKGAQQQFIIRESTKVGHYALSVRSVNRIHHFPIEFTPEKKYFIGQYNFDSLEAVISYYKENALFELEDGTKILLNSSLENI